MEVTTSPSTATAGPSPASSLRPDDEPTAAQIARFEAYLAEPKRLPESAVDPETGRFHPMSAEEALRRWQWYLGRVAEIEAEEGPDPPGSWERFVRGMNEERRSEGRGPAYAEESS